jgi:competence ComEA-like helix-hairpin-helix protein
MRKAVRSELGPARAGFSVMSLALFLLAGRIAIDERLRGPLDSVQAGPSNPDAAAAVASTTSEFEVFLRGGKMDINCATREDLGELPGIGPSLADRIVQDRAANGPYDCLSQLTRVRGVGPSLLKRMQTLGLVLVDGTRGRRCRVPVTSSQLGVSQFR